MGRNIISDSNLPPRKRVATAQEIIGGNAQLTGGSFFVPIEGGLFKDFSFSGGASQSAADAAQPRARTVNETAATSQNQLDTADPSKVKALQTIAPAVAGFQAGAQVQNVQTTEGAVLQTISAGLGGAAGGAIAGGVPGAIVGGVAGVITGGINAYLNLKSSRKARREQNRERARIEEKNRKALAQQRADVNEQMRYNRRINALNSRWEAMEKVREQFNTSVVQNENLRNLFISQAR